MNIRRAARLPYAMVAMCAGVTLLAHRASAEGLAGPDVAFNLGAASDYVFRGVSRTDRQPQVFGGVDLTRGVFYAGAWASNVDFDDSTDAEVDLYAGARPTLGVLDLDLGVYYYSYVNAPAHAGYGYFEGKAAASVPAGPAKLGVALYYSPDSFGAADGALYYELNGWIPAGEKVSLSAALGRQTFAGTGDYATWNIGLGYALRPGLGVDLRYHDTDGHRLGAAYGRRVALSLKAVF